MQLFSRTRWVIVIFVIVAGVSLASHWRADGVDGAVAFMIDAAMAFLVGYILGRSHRSDETGDE